MAVLVDQDRIDVWAQFMRDNTSPFGAMTKADLKAAVDAIDAWIVANQVAFNAAIPQPARTALSAPQKAQLFSAIVRQRFVKAA